MLKRHSRFAFIDALRGIASISVVLFHIHAGTVAVVFFATTPQWLQILLKHGYLGVQVFFVISGFVIAYSLRKTKMDFTYFGNFTLRRFIRLSPPYWIAIALTILVWVVSNAILPDRVAPLPSWQSIVAHLFYLQDILKMGNISPVFWTLCLEVQFYIVFCILLGIAQKIQLISNFQQHKELFSILATFGILSLLTAAWPLGLVSADILTGWVFPYFYMFLLGVFTWWTIDKKLPFGYFCFYIFIIVTALVINWKIDALIALLTSGLIYIVCQRESLNEYFNIPWLQYTGKISYSLYLTHATVSNPILNVGYRITKDAIIPAFLWFLVALGASFLTAHYLWRFIEKPTAEFSNRFKPVSK